MTIGDKSSTDLEAGPNTTDAAGSQDQTTYEMQRDSEREMYTPIMVFDGKNDIFDNEDDLNKARIAHHNRILLKTGKSETSSEGCHSGFYDFDQYKKSDMIDM